MWLFALGDCRAPFTFAKRLSLASFLRHAARIAVLKDFRAVPRLPDLAPLLTVLLLAHRSGSDAFGHAPRRDAWDPVPALTG